MESFSMDFLSILSLYRGVFGERKGLIVIDDFVVFFELFSVESALFAEDAEEVEVEASSGVGYKTGLKASLQCIGVDATALSPHHNFRQAVELRQQIESVTLFR